MKFREAAFIPAAVAAAVQLVSVFVFPLSDEMLGLINGAAAFLAGVFTAWAVSYEKGLAALVGFLNALIQIAIGFGAHITTGQQAALAVAFTTLAAAFTRTQVVAPVAAKVIQVAPDARIARQTGSPLV